MSMITTLSADLTTPIPETLARLLDLRPGVQLDWQADENETVIHVKVAEPSREELVMRLHELGRKHKKAGQDAVGDLIRERELDDELRSRVLE
jgi:bifunctional DNA-binding transcriptional regulator/antitoxin component of YhaV-PrlF toxin-antitoxin module